MSIVPTTEIADQACYDSAVRALREQHVRLPRFSELADPVSHLAAAQLSSIDADARDARNLYRVHWHNAADRRGLQSVPDHVVLPSSLTGVDARIVVALGNRFPLVRCHKVLAAYACLVPRLITGQFDPRHHRAVWPSTGNYCRGGVAISRILGCRSVAVLPEGMSRERFEWLEQWVSDPGDIVRTPGSESNVKEIYDACHELSQDEQNVILNQFSEFGNYIAHRSITGPSLERVFNHVNDSGSLRCAAFVAATGSAGTLAAGDYLKGSLGSKTAAVEALECPTLLYGGYGEHNIQGIGDKHVPLIHNVMNTDFVVGVSDRATDSLNLAFNSQAGRSVLAERQRVDHATLDALGNLGISSIANVLAAIKLARCQELGPDDVVMTVATDDAGMYGTEREKTADGQTLDEVAAAGLIGRYLSAVATDHVLETTRVDRLRMFNLGYYTWVEQQGVELADFHARRDLTFWNGLMERVAEWDAAIDEFNSRVAQ